VLLIKLSGLQKNTPVPIDLFAFSLGSVLAMNAMVSASVSRYIVLLAPAVDQRTFPPRMTERLTHLGQSRVTVYESNKGLGAANGLKHEPQFDERLYVVRCADCGWKQQAPGDFGWRARTPATEDDEDSAK
jgi:hypothetical protein